MHTRLRHGSLFSRYSNEMHLCTMKIPALRHAALNRARKAQKEDAMEAFTRAVIEILHRIPPGRVSTYGRIGQMAGHPNSARQVARILHSMSRRHGLPWHRVINAQGRISLPRHRGYAEQKALLHHEGVAFDEDDRVDLERYLWNGDCE